MARRAGRKAQPSVKHGATAKLEVKKGDAGYLSGIGWIADAGTDQLPENTNSVNLNWAVEQNAIPFAFDRGAKSAS